MRARGNYKLVVGIVPVKDSGEDYCLDEYINVSKCILYRQYFTDTGISVVARPLRKHELMCITSFAVPGRAATGLDVFISPRTHISSVLALDPIVVQLALPMKS